MQVPKETAMKYINVHFKQAYPIDEKVQPHFWEAVCKLCENPRAHVSKLIDETNKYCIPLITEAGWGRYETVNHTVSVFEGEFETITALAKHIAKQIVEEEKKGPLSRAEFYSYQQTVERILKYLDLDEDPFE